MFGHHRYDYWIIKTLFLCSVFPGRGVSVSFFLDINTHDGDPDRLLDTCPTDNQILRIFCPLWDIHLLQALQIVLVPYAINAAAAAAAAPANLAWLIYALDKKDVLTAFLKWYQWAGGRGAHIAILHSVLNCVPGMVLTASPWDDSSFASKGGIAYGIIAYTNWLTASLHHTRATVHVPTDLGIDAAL